MCDLGAKQLTFVTHFMYFSNITPHRIHLHLNAPTRPDHWIIPNDVMVVWLCCGATTDQWDYGPDKEVSRRGQKFVCRDHGARERSAVWRHQMNKHDEGHLAPLAHSCDG